MEPPTPEALAAALMPLKMAFDAALYGASQDRADDATGPCYLRLDPDRPGDVPSTSGNHAAFPGVAAPLAPAQLDAILARYRAAGLRWFFVELSPCAQAEAIRGWLRARGMVPFTGTRYLTLLRAAAEPIEASCELKITPLSAQTARDHRAAVGQALGWETWADRVTRALEHPEAHGFAAWDGDELVAAAAMFVRGEIGYLSHAGTRASHRRRGAQGALIAARVQRAQALGLPWCASETLSILSSLNNLRRAGFAVVYEREMWEPSAG